MSETRRITKDDVLAYLVAVAKKSQAELDTIVTTIEAIAEWGINYVETADDEPEETAEEQAAKHQ